MLLTPFVIEQTSRGERSFDIYSRLLQDRIILIFGEIDDTLASSVIAQLLYLSSIDSNSDIYLYINSPGGVISSGLAIYDVMNHINCDVVTIGMGQCCSMGAFLLSAGTKNKRYALKHTKIMIHQPAGGMEGNATHLHIIATEILKTKKLINELLAKHTNQPIEKIIVDIEKDYYLNVFESIDYGLIDHELVNQVV